MQFVYVKDLVAAMLKAAESPSAVGHAFNIATARAHPGRIHRTAGRRRR